MATIEELDSMIAWFSRDIRPSKVGRLSVEVGIGRVPPETAAKLKMTIAPKRLLVRNCGSSATFRRIHSCLLKTRKMKLKPSKTWEKKTRNLSMFWHSYDDPANARHTIARIGETRRGRSTNGQPFYFSKNTRILEGILQGLEICPKRSLQSSK
jgi:hypothetical protein